MADSDMTSDPTEERTYRRGEAAVFLKTKEKFGGLSNMAGGFPLLVNGVGIRTAEALYQACRFPHRPELQREIIEQRSPMTAKMKGKPHRPDSRKDWDRMRVRIMRWCLRVKLVQNWDAFSALLQSTEDLPIVEESRRDPFWGARPNGADVLVGQNILGRLLMELRQEARSDGRAAFEELAPPAVDRFALYEKPIETVRSVASGIPEVVYKGRVEPAESQAPSRRPVREPVPSIPGQLPF